MLLTDKIAIVTGAGRGIGRAIALTFAREGAHIVCANRTPERADAVADEVRMLGRQALPIATDVSQESSVIHMVKRTVETFGTVDILVNNAGIQMRHFVHEIPAEEFKAMLDVNLLGAFYCCKAVLPIMYAKQDGIIIFVNSRSGQQGAGFRAAYCASKAGQIGLMESLAQESRAHGVRVNTITPVGVKTDMTYELRNFDGAEIDASGFMEPEEVADAALFLASHLSRGMHGQCLNLYGGTAYRHCADLRA
jgi:NAD(P)-dependent dehydrogenase (short-subunit alcohol dehydrogenase family)